MAANCAIRPMSRRLWSRAAAPSAVELVSGQTIGARNGVIGQIHPWLFEQMVDGLDPGVAARARRVETGAFAIMPLHLAL